MTVQTGNISLELYRQHRNSNGKSGVFDHDAPDKGVRGPRRSIDIPFDTGYEKIRIAWLQKG